MPSIHLLDNETINQIAAGEVVERPASVVKELVENAIDAGSTAITVEIRDGGLSMIRVTDNGKGIEEEDVPNAFLRHATSKIENAVDLLSIRSLGFRGEALSSIASVSQVELITKTRKALMGIRYEIDGGKVIDHQNIGAPSGTTFIVRNLFYNTPARRKFLKTPVTEAGYISDLMNQMALSRPDISFKLINQNQNRLHTSGNGHLKDIIYQIYGRDTAFSIMEVKAETEHLSVSGYIGKPLLSRGNRTWENYYINGRFIKSAIITKAIEDAYKTFVMIHKYPFTALHFTIDPSSIDVNVHPRKMELKFNQSEAIYNEVYQIIRDVLTGRSLITQAPLSGTSEDEKTPQDTGNKEKSPEPFELMRLAKMGQGQNKAYPEKKPLTVADRTSTYHSVPAEKPDLFGRPQAPVQPSFKEDKAQESRNASEMPSTVKRTNESLKTFSDKGPTGSLKPLADKKPTGDLNPLTDKKPTGDLNPFKDVTPKDTRQLNLFDEQLLPKEQKTKLRIIGQVFATYWLMEYEEKLFIVDQHAAHEKVLFERFSKKLSEGEVHVQQLSPPVMMNLSMPEEVLFEKYHSIFEEMGFDIAHFGGRAYAISGVPLQLYGMNPADLMIEVLDSLTDEGKYMESSAITMKIATMACKAAVKGGQSLSHAEAQTLMEELMRSDNPYTCPHGRPTIISISKYEMEKKFKRIQN